MTETTSREGERGSTGHQDNDKQPAEVTPAILGDDHPAENARRKKTGLWASIAPYIWDDPDKSPAEKRFLFKLDLFLLSYACLGYFSKNLSQANINNAYVSGMKEALAMDGSQLTYMANVFTAGYVVGQIPAVILVTRLRPSLLVPTAEVLWAVCTFCSAAVTTVQQLYALRFLVGLFESAYFPCVIYILGSWYTRRERAKRVTIFYCTATLAQMFSGYLQAGAYDNLGGHLGHAGWQWLFIVSGVIALPAGLIGYAFNPDFPENTRAFYLSADEAALARERLAADGMRPLGQSVWDRTKIVRVVRQWQFWVLPLGYFFVQASFPVQQPAFALWLKAEGYSVYQINVWPTGQAAIAVVVQVAAGMLTDSPLLKGRRWQAIVAMQAGTFFGAVVLAVWEVPTALKFVAFYFTYCASGVPGIYFAWFSELMRHDHEMRGFVIATANIFSYIMSIWFSDAVWRTVEAPRFRAGFIAAACFGVAMMLWAVVIRVLERRGRAEADIEGRSEAGSAGRVEKV